MGHLPLEEVARLSGMSVRNVRAYASRGLLPPGTRAGRRVLYGYEHLARLRLVQALRGKGHSLTAVTAMLQGDADEDELARLADITGEGGESSTVLVQVADDAVAAAAAQRPDLPQSLVDLGAIERDASGAYLGEAAMLAASRRLVAAGMPMGEVSLLIEAAARAAGPVLEHLATRLPADGEARREHVAAAVRVAGWGFAEALRRRLGRP